VRHQLAMKCGGASGGRGMRDERDSARHTRSDPSVVPAAASSDALADACRYPHSVSDPCAVAAVTSSCWVWAERIPPRREVPAGAGCAGSRAWNPPSSEECITGCPRRTTRCLDLRIQMDTVDLICKVHY